MEEIYVGVDGGGTKTHTVVMKRDGTVIGEHYTGSTNVNSVGSEEAYKNLHDAIIGALKYASVSKESVTAVGAGMSGVDAAEDIEDRKKWVEKIFSRPVTTRIQNDGVIALISGTKKQEGMVVISGTGCIVIGMKDEEIHRASGWGPLLGDSGSGFSIGHDILKAVCRNEDGGPHTILRGLVCEELNITSVKKLIDWAYKDVSWARFASLSPLAFEAANECDQVATKILEENANSLLESIKLVYKKAQFNTKTPIVFSGGNITYDNAYSEILRKKLEKELPNLQVTLPTLSAPEAAAYLAIETTEKLKTNK